MAVYDETWKEAMNQWFEPFVAFFFPHVHCDIDWSRGWESLDKELHTSHPRRRIRPKAGRQAGQGLAARRRGSLAFDPHRDTEPVRSRL